MRDGAQAFVDEHAAVFVDLEPGLARERREVEADRPQTQVEVDRTFAGEQAIAADRARVDALAQRHAEPPKDRQRVTAGCVGPAVGDRSARDQSDAQRRVGLGQLGRALDPGQPAADHDHASAHCR